MKKAIRIEETDNVATALEKLVAGDRVQVLSSRQEPIREVSVTASLPMGHKIAIAAIPDGAEVRKYGAVIGKATENIFTGDYVHIHNVRSERMPLTDHMLGKR